MRFNVTEECLGDTWMRDLGCTNMKCRMCLIGGLPADVQYWGTSQTTNGQHIACYVRRVSVKCRSRVGQ